MAKKIISFLLCLLPFWANAQDTEALDAITAIENDGKVYLRWTMKAGNTCNGIRIYRSLDSLSFNTIGQINGICGSSSESISYDFTDVNPQLNARNYYTIELGSLGFSKVVSIEVLDFSKGIIIRPQPSNRNVEFVFKNDLSDVYYLQICTQQGKVMLEKSGIENRFEIDMSLYPNGIYVYRLFNTEKGELSSGKVVKN